MKLCSVQPFWVGGPAGGSRILRSLLGDPPFEVLAVCTAADGDRPTADITERHLPARPSFGRLESTRARPYLGLAERPFRRCFERRLAGLIREERVTCLHAIAHGGDFASVREVARRSDLPFLLSVHDDPTYALRGRPDAPILDREVGQAWRAATGRFVISPEMGEEMGRRYGRRPYLCVTDGLTEFADAPRTVVPDRLNIYFMGSFHLSYEDNFAALIEGAGLWARRSGIAPRIIIRGGAPTSVGGGAGVDLEVRPWATQEAVAEDLEEADLLYMPLPFGGEHAPLVEFSLSTKLVTYLGSGIPILYHGPEGGAERLLREEGAAIVVSDLGAEAMVEGFEAAARSGEQVAGKALALARRQFSLDEIRARFWGAVADSAR